MYTVEAVPAPELGNSSFLVTDDERGVAFVVDPLRDIERYLNIAKDHNVRITHALDTHLHNDFVSGRRELAAEAGSDTAELDQGAELTIGDMTIKAIYTPGHTPDHKSYLLTEGGRARALFSGGAVSCVTVVEPATLKSTPRAEVRMSLGLMSTRRTEGVLLPMVTPLPGKVKVEVSVPVGLISQTAPGAQPASVAPVPFMKVTSGLLKVRAMLV